MGIFKKKNREEKENFGSVLRLIEGSSVKHVDGRYRRTFHVKDDNTGELLVECDAQDKAIYSGLVLTDSRKQTWKIKPNRRIMPLRWHVYSPANKRTSEIRLPGFLTMLYPFSRTCLKITDLQSGRKLTLIDFESGFFDFIFGSLPSVWSITEDKKILARIRYLAKEDDEEEKQEKPKKKGLFSRLKKWLKGSDWALQTFETEPVMNAQTFLALYLVYNAHRNRSAD